MICISGGTPTDCACIWASIVASILSSTAVGTFHTQKDFCWLLVVMHAEVERALAGDPYLLRDMVAAVGEGEAGAHAATTLPWNGISQE